MDDFRSIESKYGTYETYSHYGRYHEIEQYKIFQKDQVIGTMLSLCAVFCVVIFITVNIRVTLFVIFSVLLVDYYLIAAMYFSGLTLNSFTGVNIGNAESFQVDFFQICSNGFYYYNAVCIMC